MGPFKCYVTLFFCKLDSHPSPRNADNIEHYTFVTLLSGKYDTPPPTPSALRNTRMAPIDKKGHFPLINRLRNLGLEGRALKNGIEVVFVYIRVVILLILYWVHKPIFVYKVLSICLIPCGPANLHYVHPMQSHTCLISLSHSIHNHRYQLVKLSNCS